MKSEDALNIITDWFHSYKDDNGITVHERHINKDYEEAKKTIEKDLEVLEILKDKFKWKVNNVHYRFLNLTTYELNIEYTDTGTDDLTKEQYELLKEWLNNDK